MWKTALAVLEYSEFEFEAAQDAVDTCTAKEIDMLMSELFTLRRVQHT